MRGASCAQDLAEPCPFVTTDDDALVAAGMPAEQRLPALLALDTDGLPQAVIPGSLCRTARAAPHRADM